jgi:hypothetical protein
MNVPKYSPTILACLFFCLLGCENENILSAPPHIQVDVVEIDFGAIAVGFSSPREIIVQNIGRTALILDTPSFENDTDQSFYISNIDSFIMPGKEGIIEVTFAPKNIESYDCNLQIMSNDPDQEVTLVRLLGEGFRQGIIKVEPMIVDFGLVNAGSAELAEVTISNIGNGDLVIQQISLSDSTNSDFEILSSTKPSVLAANSQIPIRLAYRPNIYSQPPDSGSLIIQASDPLQRETIVELNAQLNRAPIADAGNDRQVEPLQQIFLDGSNSHDPDGDLPLAYAWNLTRKPEGSNSQLENNQTETPSFFIDLIGVYEAQLFVTDSTGLTSLLPDRTLITALPAEKLLIELVWDSPIADLDLHVLAPGGSFGGMLDCYYGNKTPDWGTLGDQSDDPVLLRDDLIGFGPETLGYLNPLAGTYTIAIDYFAAHTPSGNEPTSATLRVFIDGQLKAELVKRLETQGTLWTAATLQWPEGLVVPID